MKKDSELLRLTAKDLENRVVVERETYRKLRSAHALSPIENPMRLPQQRRLLARLHTLLLQQFGEVGYRRDPFLHFPVIQDLAILTQRQLIRPVLPFSIVLYLLLIDIKCENAFREPRFFDARRQTLEPCRSH